jgi:hypothetical protein
MHHYLSNFYHRKYFSSNINKIILKRVDQHGEPRFLEQVKLFLERAAKKTDIPKDM